MTIKVIQTCNKCKKERELRAASSDSGNLRIVPEEGGWRRFGDRHACADCMRNFVDSLND